MEIKNGTKETLKLKLVLENHPKNCYFLFSPPVSTDSICASPTLPLIDNDISVTESVISSPSTNNNMNDVGCQTSFSFVSYPVYLDPTTFETDVAHDHGYTTSIFTNNILFNICSELEKMKMELENAATRIKILKETLSNLLLIKSRKIQIS